MTKCQNDPKNRNRLREKKLDNQTYNNFHMSHVISLFPVFKKNIEKDLTRRKILYLKHSCYSYSFSSEKFWGQVSLKALFRSYSSEHRIKCSNNEAIPRFLQSQMQFFPNFCSFFCPSLYCQNKFSGGPILMTFPSLNLFNPTVP